MGKYKRGRKELILCRNRKILLQRTPEEIVRQHVLNFLLDEMNVPDEYISIEYPLKKFDSISNMRADIVVWKEDQCKNKIPFLVIELKAGHITLTDEVIEQVKKYNSLLKAKYLGVSNGKTTELYECTNDGLKLLATDFYSYKDLINGEVKYKQLLKMRRLPYELISYYKYVNFLKSTSYLGQSTKPELHILIAELQNYLLCGEFIPRGRFNHKIVEDLSYGTFNSGNASGGNYTGYYRSLLVKSPQGNHTIFRIAIFGTAELQNDPTYGNRKGNTYLVVAVENAGISTNVLQLNLDSFLVADSRGFSFDIIHNGRRNGFKNEDVIGIVNQKEPELIFKGKVFLGTLPIGRSITVEEGSDLIERLLAYSACRDSLKKVRKSKKRLKKSN
ncbi:hypothetical protein CQS04_07215 [Chryseomicrobium excrementi]|uniref:Type I restriction enzyme R protein N-terminal domain-containing protein n=1 Tax=Chryseomicrobium excrementi TaxID=2041346 RepID=A0A2M9F0F4_9BACL|nr:type I restriction enzyme HsdR N-terminal domain-containing protein [Chryseomicrobium excrementi]PJK16936.1 hypothetical protein CQS04_07215 [Chryseomicrobium excrementi]